MCFQKKSIIFGGGGGGGLNNTFLLRAPIWPAAALFKLTDWSVFETAATDLDELTDTVTS